MLYVFNKQIALNEYDAHVCKHIMHSPTYISLSCLLSGWGCTSSLNNSSSLKPGKPRRSMSQKSPIVLSSIVLLEYPANRTLSAFVFVQISCAAFFFMLCGVPCGCHALHVPVIKLRRLLLQLIMERQICFTSWMLGNWRAQHMCGPQGFSSRFTMMSLCLH